MLLSRPPVTLRCLHCLHCGLWFGRCALVCSAWYNTVSAASTPLSCSKWALKRAEKRPASKGDRRALHELHTSGPFHRNSLPFVKLLQCIREADGFRPTVRSTGDQLEDI
uniref:Putative secreted protein ovary overexpressed n=1 Tax=Rhipicephalus microplus TaxID=6941 RepID=A0A6M2DC18_RHIMP